jgi:hypothetical protein
VSVVLVSVVCVVVDVTITVDVVVLFVIVVGAVVLNVDEIVELSVVWSELVLAVVEDVDDDMVVTLSVVSDMLKVTGLIIALWLNRANTTNNSGNTAAKYLNFITLPSSVLTN